MTGDRTDYAEGLRQYVRHGPYAGDTVLSFVVGVWCWWRTWAMIIGVLGALLFLGYATEGGRDVLLAFGVGIVTAWYGEYVSHNDLGVGR